MISHEAIPSNDVYPLGWSFESDYNPPRLVFHKKGNGSDSACFIYHKTELKEHLDRQCITNLEYLEGCEFYTENRLPEAREVLKAISPRHQYHHSFPF